MAFTRAVRRAFARLHLFYLPFGPFMSVWYNTNTMYVIEVIPLIKASQLETLSYYSAGTYDIGTIITVPVRKRDVQAIVMTSEPVSNAKTALKAATFSLRKLPVQADPPTLPASVIETARKLTETVPAHLGSILFSLLPPDIRIGVRPYPYTSSYTNELPEVPSVLTAVYQDRLIAYRGFIRQAFAHRGSVLFIVPHSAAVEAMKAAITTGIEKRIVTFSSTHTKRQLDASYEAFTDFSTAKLIITTPNFAFLDRHDITTIIIEGAASPHYKTKTRPYLDAREALTTYAQLTHRQLIFGDVLIRTEEEVLRRDDFYATFDEHVKRLNFNNTYTVVSPKKPIRTEPLRLITEELEERLRTTLTNKGRSFLLSARRGFAPLIICNDCGHIIRCEDSGAPFSLIIDQQADGTERRWFYCSTSGRKIPALDTCPNCTSWRLREQGIGIQKVVSEVRNIFPNAPLIQFDHMSASTPNKARQLMKRFYEEKGAILVGTKMALPYLTTPVHTGAVVSFEAMRATPSWRAEEQVLRELLELRSAINEHMVVQSKDVNDPLLQHAKRGSIDTFYDEEIGMRQMLNYPPFTTLIHLTWQGTNEQLKTIEEAIETALTYRDMHCYNAEQPSKRPVRHALLKVAAADWPDPSLLEQLRSLPPYVRVEISPERIV